jgi:hypothetical protein
MPRVRLFVLACALAAAVAIVPAAGGSGTSGIVVSQVFGGGGNAGSPYTNDYVELFNRGAAPVDVGGWSIQYATASGTSWQETPLTGTIAPGRYQLVQLAGGTEGITVPAPDVTGTMNLSSTNGKIALVRDTTPLTCGATTGSCSASALVEDLVGYGAATDYEGNGAAPALTSTAAAVRAGDGCVDSDANSADFAASAPTPRNSASPARTCSPSAPPGGASSADATVDVDIQSALSVALERPILSFGATSAGASPAAIAERVTVVSTHAGGYSLSVQRSRFTPADLPLALRAHGAPQGGALAATVAGGALVPIPIAPASLSIGTTSALSAANGDAWRTSIGFSEAIPAVAPGRYSATVTFTVIAR